MIQGCWDSAAESRRPSSCLAGMRQPLPSTRLFTASASVQHSHTTTWTFCQTRWMGHSPAYSHGPNHKVQSSFVMWVQPLYLASTRAPLPRTTTLPRTSALVLPSPLAQGYPFLLPHFFHLPNTYLTCKTVTQELSLWVILHHPRPPSCRCPENTVDWAYSNHGIF